MNSTVLLSAAGLAAVLIVLSIVCDRSDRKHGEKKSAEKARAEKHLRRFADSVGMTQEDASLFFHTLNDPTKAIYISKDVTCELMFQSLCRYLSVAAGLSEETKKRFQEYLFAFYRIWNRPEPRVRVGMDVPADVMKEGCRALEAFADEVGMTEKDRELVLYFYRDPTRHVWFDYWYPPEVIFSVICWRISFADTFPEDANDRFHAYFTEFRRIHGECVAPPSKDATGMPPRRSRRTNRGSW